MEYCFKNLNKIEFVVTDSCTGKCRHCSQGDHSMKGSSIDGRTAAAFVTDVCREFDINTVMTFGGEPLLYSDTVYKIMKTAKELNIKKRQVITNGYFSKNPEKIRQVAHQLAESGVNDLLLSVDAFHQDTIPLETVRSFAEEAKSCGIPIRLQPAWLVSRKDNNPYNIKTREILDSFHDLGIFQGDSPPPRADAI
jgi:MoaA/NifB/PqqE/SkfB family radical SAM enzyme